MIPKSGNRFSDKIMLEEKPFWPLAPRHPRRAWTGRGTSLYNRGAL